MNKKEQALIAQAKARKAQNDSYFPSIEELKAIDRFLIDEEKKKNLGRLTLRIPEDLKARFEKKADKLEVSMSQVSRKLIEGWLVKTSKNAGV